ncbi:MAG: uracil-DNA glycosylase [Comamonadaceae bacterium PBBC2]|nr:MAG: uracil-DNA glycosylase [Comamonadaceae bacterium PBBC2]
MLQEMGVRVWLPGTAFAPEDAPAQTTQTVQMPRPTPAPLPRAASAAPPERSATTSHVVTPRAADVPPVLAPHAPGSTPLALEGLDWPALADAAASCQACGLCAGRKLATLQAPAQAQQADWFFVGDPPDEDEDRQGAPFVGPAGQLLDNMLKAMGARRGEGGASGAYVTNIVKCRPPQGRLPQADEMAQCADYLRRELALVQPKVIVVMGRSAIQHLLSEHPDATGLPLGKQRGVVYRYAGLPVVVTYAPTILLRATADKAKAWADLCLALDVRAGISP